MTSSEENEDDTIRRQLPTPLALALTPITVDGCEECASRQRAGLQVPQLLNQARHGPDVFVPKPQEGSSATWRLRQRMKTANVALVMCLNIGTDPPDAVRTHPCATKECWIEPSSTSRGKAREMIGRALQEQYEKLQPRARYKQCLDPTVDDIKRLCSSLRRSAKGERVLFHYNGHGVPRPTANGELWVFNKKYTQYIPLSVYDLKACTGNPSIFVLDCGAAGALLPHFSLSSHSMIPEEHSIDVEGGSGDPASTHPSSRPSQDCIVLAACRADELLPTNPDFPADTFTACLTTPIAIALRWFIFQNQQSMEGVQTCWVDKIPGELNDRKTPLGELHWVFTAITDTIAWNSFSSGLFQKLFRQDLLVASLFRNFLFADRVLRSLNCTPVSLPALPSTSQHPLWQAWDLATEACLSRLHADFEPTIPRPLAPATLIGSGPDGFFKKQLTAFEVWLQFGGAEGAVSPPEQLPVVLQVLLSQVYRLRALILLQRFLDLGPWAVNLALSVGIFPYMLKLLQAPAADLRQVLVRIWARILSMDRSCQRDLIKESAHMYFISHLCWTELSHEQKYLAAFALTAVMDRCATGQQVCLREDLHRICARLLSEIGNGAAAKSAPAVLLRRWICLCIAKLCWHYPAAQEECFRCNIHHSLFSCLKDSSPGVRCAAIYGIASLFSFNQQNEDSELADDKAEAHIYMAQQVAAHISDASGLVRREVVLSLGVLISNPYHFRRFVRAAYESMGQRPPTAVWEKRPSYLEPVAEEAEPQDEGSPDPLHWLPRQPCPPKESAGHRYNLLWLTLKRLHQDPFPPVAEAAATVVQAVNKSVYSSTTPIGIGKRVTSYNGNLDQALGADRKLTRALTTSMADNPSPSTSPSAARHSADTPPEQRGRALVKAISAHDFQSAPGVTHSYESPVNLEEHGSEGVGFPTNDPSEWDAAGLPSDMELPASNWLDKPHLLHSFYWWSCLRCSQPSWRTRHAPVADMTTFSAPPMTAGNAPRSPAGMGSAANGSGNSTSVCDHRHVTEDPLSPQGALQLYLSERNERVKMEAAALSEQYSELATALGDQGGIDESQTPPKMLEFTESSILDSDAPTSLLQFHPYEPLLVVANDKDKITVWNFQDRSKYGSLCNTNARGSRMTVLGWLNETSDSLLYAGSDDGIVRVWHGLLQAGEHGMEPRLVSAFHAAPDLAAGQQGAGLVMNCQQGTGLLMTGGSSPLIRVWDMASEQCWAEWPILSESCVTEIASPNWEGEGQVTHSPLTGPGMMLAGYGNGCICLYDPRQGARAVRQFREHGGWIVKLHFMGSGAGYEMLSGSVTGDIRFWDIRMSNSLGAMSVQKSPMTAAAVHERVPLLATGSHNQFIKVLTMDGETLSVMRYHDGFLGQRIGPVSALAFHPHSLVLAAGATDSIISVYTAE